MMQADFVCDAVKRLGDMHTAIQTSGFTDLRTYQKVVGHFDYVLQDIKLADEKLHKKYTGVSNQQILENIAWLKESDKAFVFRVPLIPGITDTEENLDALRQIAGDSPHELLPYNTLAGAKYPMLGIEFPYDKLKNEKE